MKALNVNKLTRCGVTFKFWCASFASSVSGDISSHMTLILPQPLLSAHQVACMWCNGLGHACPTQKLSPIYPQLSIIRIPVISDKAVHMLAISAGWRMYSHR